MSSPKPGGPDCLCASPAPVGHWSLCPVAKLQVERDSLAARVSSLEAERDALRSEALGLAVDKAMAVAREKAQEARRAWDAVNAPPLMPTEVERDAARADVESQREECDALRARLSRAREALDAWDEEAPHYQCDLDLYAEWCKRQDAALAALRAALSEPPGG